MLFSSLNSSFNFNFQCATESVEAVAFSFMTTEEIRKTSVLNITEDILLDGSNAPVLGGLYDPALGPTDDRTALYAFTIFHPNQNIGISCFTHC